MLTGLDFTTPKDLGKSISGTREEITSALTASARDARHSPVESTHQIRKKLKLYRAFLKLLKNEPAEQHYKTANAFLRDQGRIFSGLRDAHVRRLLLDEYKNIPLFRMFEDLINYLHANNENSISEQENALLIVNNLFQEFAGAVEKSSELDAFFSHLKPSADSVFRTFSEAFDTSRRAFQSGFIYPDSDLIHEWRKRLKDVQYQMEIILGEEPETAAPEYSATTALCDILGRVNDLYMMKDWIRNKAIPAPFRQDIPAFLSELKQENNTLQRNAEREGSKLYALAKSELEESLQSSIKQ